MKAESFVPYWASHSPVEKCELQINTKPVQSGSHSPGTSWLDGLGV